MLKRKALVAFKTRTHWLQIFDKTRRALMFLEHNPLIVIF